MSRCVETLLYTLMPGTGAEFHALMREVSVPLHRASGLDVVAYGPSLDDADRYFLIRAYRSLDDLTSSQETFYASPS